MTVGTSSLWYLEFYIINKIKKNATLMAQEGVIVRIAYCFILKYKKNGNPNVYFNSNISVQLKFLSRDRKVDVSVEWPRYK